MPSARAPSVIPAIRGADTSARPAKYLNPEFDEVEEGTEQGTETEPAPA
ncbi:MAG: hypothetical protein JWQ89_2062 [Devosia sp.]|nr:hypothetical protein [Devosia sp.]